MNSWGISSLNLACARHLKASNRSGVSWRQTIKSMWNRCQTSLKSTGRMQSCQMNCRHCSRSLMKRGSLQRKLDQLMTNSESRETSKKSIIVESSRRNQNLPRTPCSNRRSMRNLTKSMTLTRANWTRLSKKRCSWDWERIDSLLRWKIFKLV